LFICGEAKPEEDDHSSSNSRDRTKVVDIGAAVDSGLTTHSTTLTAVNSSLSAATAAATTRTEAAGGDGGKRRWKSLEHEFKFSYHLSVLFFFILSNASRLIPLLCT
jgi:hypothetical protein